MKKVLILGGKVDDHFGTVLCRQAKKEGDDIAPVCVSQTLPTKLDGKFERFLRSFDCVIVGNVEGAGVAKAALIPSAMRDRVIVVWNNFVPGAGLEKEYAEMGYTRFASRGDYATLLGYIRAM